MCWPTRRCWAGILDPGGPVHKHVMKPAGLELARNAKCMLTNWAARKSPVLMPTYGAIYGRHSAGLGVLMGTARSSGGTGAAATLLLLD